MIKTAVLTLIIASSVIAIALSSFSLSFDNMNIYPVDRDDIQYQQLAPDNEVPQLDLIW